MPGPKSKARQSPLVVPRLVQFLFWLLALSLGLRLALFLLGPLAGVLRGLGWASAALAAWFRPARRHRRLDPQVI